MAKLKPWYKVVTPREDLREGKPLDAAEFAVHLDQVRDGRATEDYRNPERFFERTYLTKNLLGMASEAVRRLSGEKTETSAIFNMATQFGGGKTHALTLLYHLARHGNRSHSWLGVDSILDRAGVVAVPEAATAVFVGTEFDSHHGRGGEDGTPHRKTPWGEIAYQLGGQDAFDVVAQHETRLEAPGGNVIRAILPEDQPAIILIDELMNYVNRNRQSGLAGQLYSFVQNLCSVARGSDRVVLVVSLPASVAHEMTADDEADFKRFKKILDREGKQVLISAESETTEIIRRRLFEWDPRAVNREGRALLSRDAAAVCAEYARWTADNSNQIPMWFPLDHASAAFEATYPFHPSVLSVFERKWQELPGFQRTRGILRLLALWVSQSYQHGYKDARADLLIALGSAPLEDPMFRTAVFEQLGEQSLEGAVTTDICGKKESHAIRLDDEAVDTIRKARIHRRVATTIFFESNGGQIAKERRDATVPEIRLAVAGPELDLGNVETALNGLIDTCYYLSAEGNKYRFGTKENLNKRYADRRGNIREADIDSLIREEVQQAFGKQDGIEPVFFPSESSQIADRPSLRLVILGPEESLQETPDLADRIDSLTRKVGAKGRTYKSALIWVVAESSTHLEEEARRLLAWETIRDEGLDLDEIQQKQLSIAVKKARRDLRESVWRAYKNVYLLDKENDIARIDLGLVTSSAAESLTRFLLQRLREMGEIEKEVSPRFLARNWPPSKVAWSTKEVRDAFFATPKFPRLQFPDSIRGTIARGVTEGVLGYVGKATTGEYDPFWYEHPLLDQDVEITDDMYIIPAEEARIRVQPSYLAQIEIDPETVQLKPGTKQVFQLSGFDQRGEPYSPSKIDWTATGGAVSEKGLFTAEDAEGNFSVSAQCGEVEATAKVAIAEEPIIMPPISASLSWSGALAPQKWTNFYMKVLSKLVSRGELDLHVTVAANFDNGVSDQLADEIRAALRSLDLQDDVQVD